jgi:hypothetical protein
MNRPSNATGINPAQWRSTIQRLVLTLVILAVLLFVPAGRIDWTRGWLFLLVFTVLMIGAMLYFLGVNPDMFAVRSRIHPGTNHWDKIVVGFLFLGMLAIPPVTSPLPQRWNPRDYAGIASSRFLPLRVASRLPIWTFASLSLIVVGTILTRLNARFRRDFIDVALCTLLCPVAKFFRTALLIARSSLHRRRATFRS